MAFTLTIHCIPFYSNPDEVMQPRQMFRFSSDQLTSGNYQARIEVSNHVTTAVQSRNLGRNMQLQSVFQYHV